MAPPSKEDSSEAPLVIRASVPDPETQASLVADLAFAFDAHDLSEKLIFNMAESGRLDLGLFSTTWHNVRLTLDLAGFTGSVMVDGRPLMDGIPLLRIPISGLLPEISVSRAGGESANVWIDDLEIIFEDQSAKPAVEGTTAIKPIVSDRFDRYVVGIFPSQGGWLVGVAPSPTSPDDQAMPPVIPPLESDLASTDGSEFISPSASLDVRRAEISAVSIAKNISLPERTPYDVSLASFAIVAELPPAPTEEIPTENAVESREIDPSAGLLPQTDPQAQPVGDAGGTARTLSAASRGVYYIYSFDGRLLAEYDLYGVCQSDYIYVGNRLVAEFKPVQSQYLSYTQDGIRSTRVITDDTGSVVYAESYDPYGGVQQTWAGNTYEPNRQFADKERDIESGLDYFGARYYSTSAYRFITVDPVFNKTGALAIPQLFNLYSYCRNSPVSYVDPFGLDNYIFYDPNNFTLQAWAEYDRLRSKDPNEPIHVIAVSTTKQFEKLWSSMVIPTDVTLIFHSGSGKAGPTTISIDAKNAQYLTSDPEGKTPSGKQALYIGDLENKSIGNLALYICHAGDPRVTSNVARTFFNTQNVNSVKASPGYVNFNNPPGFFYGVPSHDYGWFLPSYAPKSSTKWIYLRR